MSKLNSNYELISNKASNPVTTTPYIKHGEKWLDEMLNESGGRIDAVEDGVAANTEAISQNTTNISTNTTNISGLDTRVTALEQGGGGGGGGDNVGRIDRTEGATQHGEIFNLYTGTQINQATGYMSHAEGNETKAEGSSAHSEGYKTTASGSQSHAEGAGSVASGDYSHAEGNYTTAYDYAHAEGESSTASGTASHAEGHYTHAEGKYSHAEGEDTYATKDGAHAEGLESNASGSQSHAEGNSTTASGSCSHAEGSGTTASGSCSHAEGGDTTASGTFAHAEGTSTTAFGYYSHAEGFNTQATASGSHAEGNGARAFKEAAHAEGVQTTADGLYAHAEGNYTTASAEAAHAEGKNSIASGLYSHAEGEYTYAEDWGAHSEGKNTTASGKYSHAENSYNEALGENSHAEGNYTISSGYRTHTEGFHTKASGDNAHAEGYYTKALSNNQHVSGTANIEDKANKYAVIVGNGLWEGNESNAYTLDWQGNAWYAGDVTGNKDGVEYKLSDMKDKYTLPEGGIPASDLAEGVLPTVTDEYNPEGTAAVSGKAVAAAISAIPTPMQFKGTLGTGGTRTSLPTAEASNEGHTYRVITAGTYASQAAKVGDVFVSNGSAWIYIPAGDDAANSIVMTNYTSDKSSAGTSAIANTDTVTKAIGKVDNRLGNAETEIGKKVNKTSVSYSKEGGETTSVINVTDAKAQMAMVASIKGKTQKIVQLVDIRTDIVLSSFVRVDSISAKVALTTAQSTAFTVTLTSNVSWIAGHKYMISCNATNGYLAIATVANWDSAPDTTAQKRKIVTCKTSYVGSIVFGIPANKTENQTVTFQIFDLTAMYGAGKEPTSVDNVINSYVPTGSYLWNTPVESFVSTVIDNTVMHRYNYVNPTTEVVSNAKRAITKIYPVPPTKIVSYTVTSKSGKAINSAISGYNNVGTRIMDLGWFTGSTHTEQITREGVVTVALVFKYTDDADITNGDIVLSWNGGNETTALTPTSIKNLPDYGIEGNIVDLENNVYYHNRAAVDLGTLTWTWNADRGYTSNSLSSKIKASSVCLCAKYDYNTSSWSVNNTCGINGSSIIWIADKSYANADTFKANSAGVILIYELADSAKEKIPLTDFIRPLPVEQGGTLTLVNEHNLDVDSVIKYKKEV